MDKIKKILFITFSAAVLMLTACKHDVKTGTVKGDGITADKTITLNLNTNGDYTVFSTKNNSSRTIVSNPYTAGELVFYMYGSNVTKQTHLGMQEITVNSTDGKTGKASLEIGSYVWELCIVAYPSTPAPTVLDYDGSNEATILADAVLIGRASADLRGDTNKVDFVLMPDGLTRTGNISIKLQTGGWTMDSAYTAKVGIYDHETGTEISALTTPKADGVTEKSFNSTDGLIPNAAPENANYTANGKNIAPGNSYDLVVEFTSPNGKKYYWSDNLVVLPGKGNSETVVIPNTIMLPPDPPTAFNAGYILPGSDIASMYQVEFTWTRSAGKTEKYYELQIASLGIPDVNTDDDNTNDVSYSLPTDDSEWEAEVFKEADGSNAQVDGYSALTSVEKYGMDFYQNHNIWVSGSLLKGNETATTKLVLGKRYFARIRAINDAGESAWAYVTLNGNTSTGSTAFTSQTINLYRITYQKTDMNGKLVTYTSTPAFENVQYYNQNETDGVPIAISNRNAAEETNSTRDLTVTDQTAAYWAYWKNYNVTGEDPLPYKGFENLTLIPVFAKDANWTIFDDTENLMDRTNITLTKESGDGTLGTIDANNYISIDINGVKSIKWALSYPTGIEYEYCYLTMAKTSSYNSYVYSENIDTVTKEFPVMDLTDCESVKYMAVIHYGTDKKDYTLPIVVSIVE